MSNTTSRRKASKAQAGLGVKRKVAESPGAPVRVTDDAQASIIDVNAFGDFVFKAQPHDDLPPRPSTSGGSVATSSNWTSLDNRRTRDDLFYTRRAPDGGMSVFNFPIPGSAPAPFSSSSSVSPPQLKFSTRWPLPPSSATVPPAKMGVSPMEIGMALGSPTHQPTRWPAEPSIDVSTVSPSPDLIDDGMLSEAAPTKHKNSRWNPLRVIFGGHHKKAHAVSQQPFYQLQPEETFVTTIESGPLEVTDGSATKDKTHRSRSRGRSFSGRRSNKHKPDVKRAATTPVKFDFEDLQRGRPRVGKPQQIFGGGSKVSEVEDSGPLHQDHMMLDVNIPSIHMERYSVMFGSVLRNSAASNSSALLARRQATLDRLKTANEELAMKERELEERAQYLMPRRATSPHITRSPAFSLFPNPPGTSRLNVYDGPIERKKSPLQRSNTSPAALSPAQQTFVLAQGSESRKQPLRPPTTVRQAQEQNSSRHDGGRGTPSITRAHQSHLAIASKKEEPLRNWAPEQLQVRLESPDHGSEQQDRYLYTASPVATRLKLREPVWNMVSPQHKGTSFAADSSTSRSDHSTSTSASSISTASTTPNDSPIEKVEPQHAPATSLSHSVTTNSAAPRPSRIPLRENRAPSLPAADRRLDESGNGRAKAPIDSSQTQPRPQLRIPLQASKTIEKHSPSPLDLTRTSSPLAAVAAGESPVIGRVGRAFVVEGTRKEKVNGGEEKKKRKTKEWGGDGVGEIRIGRKASEVGEIRVAFMVETGEVGGHVHRRSEEVVLEG